MLSVVVCFLSLPLPLLMNCTVDHQVLPHHCLSPDQFRVTGALLFADQPDLVHVIDVLPVRQQNSVVGQWHECFCVPQERWTWYR